MLKKLPLVSVILPVYNAETYVHKCIESIVKQTYKNIELIIIDDGSKDNSSQICKGFSKLDSRVEYIYQDNQGPSMARNKGIEASNGKFIFFVDSDDYLEKNAVELLVYNSENVDIVIAGYNNIYKNNGNIISMPIIPSRVGKFTIDEFLSIFGETLRNQLFHYTWHKLYKSSIVKKINFKKDISVGEDLIFNTEYVNNIKSVSLTNAVVYNHIKYNEVSITKRYHDKMFLNRKKIHKELIRFLTENNHYYGENKIEVEKLYAKRVASCLLDIHNEESPLSIKGKKIVIAEIINDETVRDVLPYFKKQTIINRLLGKMIFFKRQNILLIYSKLVSILIEQRRKIKYLNIMNR